MRSKTIFTVVVATTLALSASLAEARPGFRFTPRPIPIHPTVPHVFPQEAPPIRHPEFEGAASTNRTPGIFDETTTLPIDEQSIRIREILDRFKKEQGEDQLRSIFEPQTDEQFAKGALNQAKRAGVPDEVLAAIAAQKDQFVRHDDLECCLFRRPLRGWEQYAEREAAEAALVLAMRTEQLTRPALQFMVLSDASHVKNAVLGKKGIPLSNRARSTDYGSFAEVIAEIDFMAKRAGGDGVEFYLIAKHEEGRVVLPNGVHIPADDLRAYAHGKGMALRFWGCETGLTESQGIVQSFDVLPLIASIGKQLRSADALTRAEFHNSIHRDTGLEIAFDALEVVAEGQRVTASVMQHRTQAGNGVLAEVGTFELGMPRGHVGPGAFTTTTAATPEAAAASAPSPSAEVVTSSVPEAAPAPVPEEAGSKWLAYLVLAGGLGVIAIAVRPHRGQTSA